MRNGNNHSDARDGYGIRARDVWAAYGERKVLSGVDLNVEKGKFVALAGPNGVGKSTLLRLVSGVIKPTRGSIEIAGLDVSALSTRERARLVAVVPQDPELPNGAPAIEVVLMGRNPHLGLLSWESDSDVQTAIEAMRMTYTEDFIERPVDEMSGGERQRVAIAIALAQQTPIILLDEPTANLDLAYQPAIMELMRGLVSSGKTILAAVHDLTLAAQFCDEVAADEWWWHSDDRRARRDADRGQHQAGVWRGGQDHGTSRDGQAGDSELMAVREDMDRKPLGKVVMMQGTGSSVGKSLLVTGLCGLFARDGYRVAPFKAQNMSLNSGVTPDGLEIGRAQVAQAQAAGIEPSVEMNPILLKPEADSRSQLVVMGRMSGVIHSSQFADRRHRREVLWPHVANSLDALRSQFDIVVIEGAGSPAEINLRAGDIVNMAVALYAVAPVFVIGDIDKGGVFASLYGTHALISEEERGLVKGFIINKFRGFLDLLTPGLGMIEELTGVPVVGVVPYLTDVYVPEEDSPREARMSDVDGEDSLVEVAIVALPHLANFDEFDPLARRSDTRLRYVREAKDFGNPDLVILPGSKVTVADLDFVRNAGFESRIRNHLWNGAGANRNMRRDADARKRDSRPGGDRVGAASGGGAESSGL